MRSIAEGLFTNVTPPRLTCGAHDRVICAMTVLER